MPQYEAWCHSCNVTFPPDQKRCLHCGGALRPDSPTREMRRGVEPEFLDIETDGATPITFDTQEAPVSAYPELPMAGEATDTEAEPVRSSLLRAGMTVVWMVLLAAGYAYRACSQ